MNSHRLQLREVTIDDVNSFHELNSFPEVDKYNTLGIPENITVTEKLVAEIIASQTATPRVRFVFVITDKEIKNLMGLIGLVFGKPNYNSAELWYKLLPKHWNKGYITEAVSIVLAYGFNNLKLHRIEAGCATQNIASIKVLEKSGFIREAHTRKLLPIRGEWLDNYGYAIFI